MTMADIKQISRRVNSLMEEIASSKEDIGLRAELINRLSPVREVCQEEIKSREQELRIGFTK